MTNLYSTTVVRLIILMLVCFFVNIHRLFLITRYSWPNCRAYGVLSNFLLHSKFFQQAGFFIFYYSWKKGDKTNINCRFCFWCDLVLNFKSVVKYLILDFPLWKISHGIHCQIYTFIFHINRLFTLSSFQSVLHERLMS